MYNRFRFFFIKLFNVNTSWNNYIEFYFSRDFKDSYFTESTFFQKTVLILFPNYSLNNWNIYDPVVCDLKKFRATNYPKLNIRIEQSFYSDYKFSLKNLNKIGNFFMKSKLNKDNQLKFFYKRTFRFFENKRLEKLYHLYIYLYFVETRFYYFFNLDFFKTKEKNFSEFNLIFLVFLRRLENMYKFRKDFWSLNLNLNNFNDFFYFFKKLNLYKSKKNFFKVKKNFTKLTSNTSVNDVKLHYFNKTKYLNRLNVSFFSNLTKFLKLNHYRLYWTELYFNVKGVVETIFLKKNKKNSSINFSESSTNKYIDLSNGTNLTRSNYTFFFIRKNKIFNKGRYSRNRQTYRTGFYWCLWINIFVVYGLHYLFYRFTFVFGYLWLPFIVFFGSFLFARVLKYNFHNFNYIFKELNAFFNWSGLMFKNFYDFIYSLVSTFFKKSNLLHNYTHLALFNSIFSLLAEYFYNFKKFLKNYKNKSENSFFLNYVNLEKSQKKNPDFLHFLKNFLLNK